MLSNPVTDVLSNRKFIRKYQTELPSGEVVRTIVRDDQQAPFAYQHNSLPIGGSGVHRARLQSATPEC